ncbi:SPX domain-containing protein 1-like [Arachis hypogaea]|uniref:SPX domain-containing protein 1-like n=1 Tax=Arachis hypogaea TaxID=3818 RepID=UPI003B225106
MSGMRAWQDIVSDDLLPDPRLRSQVGAHNAQQDHILSSAVLPSGLRSRKPYRNAKQLDPAPKSEDRPAKRSRLKSPRDTDSAALEISKEELDFRNLLEKDLEKFNKFLVEKEEEYIIRLKELQDRVAKVNVSSEELMKIRKEIVDFHG